MTPRGIGWSCSIVAGATLVVEIVCHSGIPEVEGWAMLGIATGLLLWLAIALLVARRDRELDIVSRLMFMCPISHEWVIEVDGLPVARILNPEFSDMFWQRYQVQSLLKAPDEAVQLFRDDFWYGGRKLLARHVELNITVETFMLNTTSEQPPYILVRSLPELLPRWTVWKLKRRARASRVSPT